MENNGYKRIIYYNNLQKELPSNKIIYFIIIIIKIMPLFIVTHDWNISLNKGISYWLRILTLCEFFANRISYDIYPYIILILFLTLLFVYFMYKCYHLLFDQKKLFKLYSIIIFHIYYVFIKHFIIF